MNRDDAYLLDMLLVARQMGEFSAGLSLAAFDHSRLHQLAMVQLIAMSGEAAQHISTEFQQAHPEIEWSNMIGMRNRVIHRYDEVNLDIVWSVMTAKAPDLIRQLEPLVPPDTEEN